MPSITRRPAREPDRRAAVEAEVVSAARRLLARGAGFTELGVQQIAEEAGVARSTFYLYFRNKSDLLLQLAGELKQRIYDLGASWTPTGPGGGLDGLAANYEAMVRFYRENAEVLAAIAETSAYDPEVRDYWEGQLARFAGRVAEVVAEEQRAGRTAGDFDPVTAGRVMVWGGERVIGRHVAMGDAAADASVARELAGQHWFGVYHRQAG
ncbi:hypothetical protein Pth03_52020 [Planotetraspora thailandica]|uniref:HTH tetR-type domain-containing protein n=1 Tax=Planotetraspora thailandica TaxID=487172 RepID=A0A8J3V4Y0_9ACTN|nr:TetR/AcrR family transcriptional regulator [Planotetraspora thailandica]GII56813.1 hypothetical protein Pth03_52020 [Planotetraspora thailandica]